MLEGRAVLLAFVVGDARRRSGERHVIDELVHPVVMVVVAPDGAVTFEVFEFERARVAMAFPMRVVLGDDPADVAADVRNAFVRVLDVGVLRLDLDGDLRVRRLVVDHDLDLGRLDERADQLDGVDAGLELDGFVDGHHGDLLAIAQDARVEVAGIQVCHAGDGELDGHHLEGPLADLLVRLLVGVLDRRGVGLGRTGLFTAAGGEQHREQGEQGERGHPRVDEVLHLAASSRRIRIADEWWGSHNLWFKD